MVILTMAVCYFEVTARINFGQASYASYYTLFSKMFPPSLTLGESLKLFRSCFVFIVMLLIYILDLTLDKKSSDKDPMVIMNSVLELQATILKHLGTVKAQLQSIEQSPKKDDMIRCDMTVVQ